jgi:hypothetical protein
VTHRAPVAALALSLAACQNLPPAYAPPEQRAPLPEFRPYRVSRLVRMSDGDAAQHVVADILGVPAPWSWTGRRPVVRVRAPESRRVRYVIDFAIAEATFATTGPVTIRFLVNGRALASVRYTFPGPQHFEQDVPYPWLEGRPEAEVGAEIDKVWISPTDGVALGFILTSIGLMES